MERKGIAMGMGRKGVGNRKSDNDPQGLSSSSSATSDRNLGGVRVEEKEKKRRCSVERLDFTMEIICVFTSIEILQMLQGFIGILQS